MDTLTNEKRIRNCLIISLSTAYLIGFDAIFQFFSGVDFLRQHRMVILYGETIPRAITASFTHYNSLSTYLLFNLSLILALLISIKEKMYKLILVLLMLLLQVCLMLTFSRGSWIGFLFALILMLFLSPKVNKLVTVFIIFILVMLFVPGIRERALFIFSPQGDTDRFVIWKGTFRMIKEHPLLGLGLGTYMDYFMQYVRKGFIQYAHNSYLQIWAETGIFALLSFILFIGSIFYKGINAFRKTESDYILLGFLCAFFGFLTHAFFDCHLYSLQLAALFWFMAGIIVALIRLDTT
jgi:putative inorganic carbon (HCO3(-)) transporter